MRKNTVDCINCAKNSVVDYKTKKPYQADFVGVKERTFIYFCKHCGAQFEVKV